MRALIFRIHTSTLSIFLLFACLLASNSFAATTTTTINIPFDALQPGSNGNISSDPLTQYISSLLQKKLVEAGLPTQGNSITTSIDTPSMTGGGCTANVVVDPSVANVTFSNNSSVNLTLEGIRDITLQINLSGNINFKAATVVTYGAKIFGNCEQYARDSGDLHSNVNFVINLALQVQLQPSYDGLSDQIALDKFAQVSASSRFSDIDIDGKFGGLNITGILVEALESKLIDNFTKQSSQLVKNFVVKTNNRLNGLDQNGNSDPAYLPAFNDVSIFQLPPEINNSEFVRKLISFLGLPEMLFDTLDRNPSEILYIMLALEDEDKRAALAELGSTLVCDAIVNKFAIDLPTSPIYTNVSGQCELTSSFGADLGSYYSDQQCLQQISFKPEDITTYCQSYSSESAKSTLGNAAAWGAIPNQFNDPLPQVKSQVWTSSIATRLDLGTKSKATLLNPFMKRVSYKTITNTGRGNGTCELEMRIYKPAIMSNNLTPIMAIHGGTWTGRGFSFIGLEASTPFLVDKGHIVFAPFYRLAGEKDGNPECNGVGWREISSDIQDALLWIKSHGPALGANDQAVNLFGQSAGANLAIWLATEQPNDIGRVLTLYPPLDTLEFFKRTSMGEYQQYANFGKRALLTFFGARGGTTEIDIDKVEFSGLDTSNPPSSLEKFIPDTIFNFSNLSPDNLPKYLQRCASMLAINVADINLLQPSTKILNCVKQELSEFILATSFFHKVIANPVPLMIIQGTDDDLVPAQQVVKLCNFVAPGSAPNDVSQLSGLTETNCGGELQIAVIEGAAHMLDFGLCIGKLCPAGAETSDSRRNVVKALNSGLNWLTLDTSTNSANETSTSNKDGGGGLLWASLLLLLVRIFASTRISKT